MDDEEDKDTEYRPKQQKIKRENTFGAIEGMNTLISVTYKGVKIA